MTKLTIEINLDNAAFEEGQYEIARILQQLADTAENGSLRTTSLRDINGNKVGHVQID